MKYGWLALLLIGFIILLVYAVTLGRAIRQSSAAASIADVPKTFPDISAVIEVHSRAGGTSYIFKQVRGLLELEEVSIKIQCTYTRLYVDVPAENYGRIDVAEEIISGGPATSCTVHIPADRITYAYGG